MEPSPEQTIAPPRPSLPLASRRRPLIRQVLHIVRRTHLYIGLFLFPWAILYGVTGFLFNHPTFLPDATITAYRRGDLVGTALEELPDPHAQAEAIVTALNTRQQPANPYRLAAGEARYATREAFVATVKAEKRSFFVTFEPRSGSGVIRETTPTTESQPPAPFATGQAEAPRQRGMGMMGPMKHDHAGLKLDDSLIDRLKSAIPVLLERKGFPKGDVTVTTSPDLKFPVDAAGQVWTATFNPITTTVTGAPGTSRSDMTLRTFLLRMHLTRGYPGEMNTKWVWALGVDAIALTLCFWGFSGLLMWWQIKSTRRAGYVVLAVSALLATALGFGMHNLLAA